MKSALLRMALSNVARLRGLLSCLCWLKSLQAYLMERKWDAASTKPACILNTPNSYGIAEWSTKSEQFVRNPRPHLANCQLLADNCNRFSNWCQKWNLWQASGRLRAACNLLVLAFWAVVSCTFFLACLESRFCACFDRREHGTCEPI